MKLTLDRTVRGLITLYSTSLVMSFGHGMIFPAIPAIASAFEVSLGAAAQVITAHAVGRFAGPIPAGIIVDRLGTRLAVVAGPAIVAGAAFSIAITPSFALLLVAMFVAGVGESLWFIGREVAGVDLVRPEQRGRLMSGFMGFTSMGNALGPALGGVIVQFVGFREVFVVYTGLALVVLVVSFLARMATSSNVAARAPRTGAKRSGWPSLSSFSPSALVRLVREIEPALRATYLILVFATFAMMAYRMVMQAILPVYADGLGMTPTQIGLLFSISGIFVFAMIVPAGFITDKVGRKWATVPSTAAPGLVFLLIPFADTFLLLAVLSAVLGLSNGLSLGSVATSTYDVVPSSSRGRLQALRRTTAEVGGVSGPLAGGVIADAAGPGVPFLVFGPLLVLAGLLLAFGAKETLVKPGRGSPSGPPQ